YEDIFEAMNIPFVTVAGRGYYNQQEVWDVLNLLKALHNPADNLSLASVLRSPMFSFTDEMLFALRQLRDEETEKRLTLWQAIQATDVPLLSDHQHKQCADAFDLLARLRVLAGRTSIAEFLRLALSETGYLATLTGLPNGTRLRRNVEKLIAIAQESGKITLSEFAYYLNDLTDREVRESKAALDTEGAVQLMTVHASKGLEFPVVVLVDAGWSNNRGTNAPVLFDTATGQLACKIYDDVEASYEPTFPFTQAQHLQKLRDEAERKRLLYVAATRARDCLIISGEVGIKKDGDLSISGWLELTMQELDIDDLSEMRDGYTFDYANDGKVRVHLPTFDNASIRALQSSDEVIAWRELDIHEPVDPPPLTPPVMVPEQRLLGHISATQLANIGGYRYGNDDNSRRFYRQTVRRHIIDDTSAVIADVARTREPKVRPRQLGEIVHEALRYWRFPEQHANIDAILRSYAWQQNITDSAQVEDAVRRAHNLLEKFQQSKLYQRISTTRAENAPYYPELPFIYRTDKRIIHGVIDLLFKHGDEWHLVDYKTSTVRGGYANIKSHAQRYHLQVGVYAAAARQELQQQTPRVFIHYIQYNRTVEVPTEVWQRELIQLEKYIGDLLGDI
ncbi:MAG: 3'-5' exonuclease, partial [Chloroflexota bacterium]